MGRCIFEPVRESNLGVLKRDVKEIREGIEDARESLKIGGGGEVNYYLPYLYGMVSLANIEDKKEHANVALDVAKKVLGFPTLTPEQKANVLYQRASAYLYLKDVKLAIEDYQSAIASFPAHIGSYMGLAQCYIIARQLDKALETFTAAITAVPNDHLLYNNRGLFLQQQGKNQDAMRDFNKAIELRDDFATAYTNRGYTYQAMGNLSAAEADFTKAISLEPKNPLFTSLRGTCRLSQGKTTGAIEDYTQAIRLNSQNPVAHADLGFAKFFCSRFRRCLFRIRSIDADRRRTRCDIWIPGKSGRWFLRASRMRLKRLSRQASRSRKPNEIGLMSRCCS